MTITVLPEVLAIKMMVPPTRKMAVISKTDKQKKNVTFPANSNIVRILRLRFDDELSSLGNGPKQEDFEGLKEFVDDICKKTDTLMIHCAAGMSRSPAVAEAIAKYLSEKCEVVYDGPDYAHKPNPLVHRLACCELGIED